MTRPLGNWLDGCAKAIELTKAFCSEDIVQSYVDGGWARSFHWRTVASLEAERINCGEGKATALILENQSCIQRDLACIMETAHIVTMLLKGSRQLVFWHGRTADYYLSDRLGSGSGLLSDL